MPLRAYVVDQLKALFPVVPITYGLTLLALIVAGSQRQVPVAILVRDPAQTAHYPFYVGLFSTAGGLLWAAAASACFFAAAAVRERWPAAYMAGGGLLSVILGLDDTFILHEEVLPQLVGIPEKVVLAVYGVLAIVYFVGFIRLAVRTDIVLLGLALACFAASELFDQGLFNQGLNFLLDDGCKLLGIVGWTTYYIRTGLQLVRRQSLRPLQATREA